MLQVTFRDLLPSETLLGVAREGYSLLVAQHQQVLGCLSITIQRLRPHSDGTPRFRALLQVFQGTEAHVTIKALASEAHQALRNVLAMAAGWATPAVLGLASGRAVSHPQLGC